MITFIEKNQGGSAAKMHAEVSISFIFKITLFCRGFKLTLYSSEKGNMGV